MANKPELVVKAMGEGFARTRALCFSPFSWRRWVQLTVAPWLMGLGTVLGIGLPHLRWLLGEPTQENIMGWLEWIAAHQWRFMGVMLAVTCVAFVFYVITRYLGSRGHFMLIDIVRGEFASNRAAWLAHREHAWSFFKFKIAGDLVVFNVWLVPVVIGLVLAGIDLYRVWPHVEDYHAGVCTVLGVILAGPVALVLGLLAGAYYLLVLSFTPLIMLRRGVDARRAAGIFYRDHFRQSKATFLLMFLFLYVLLSVRGVLQLIATVLVIVCTCGLYLVLSQVPVAAQFASFAVVLVTLPASMMITAVPTLFFDRLVATKS